jgi:hypothetical protein
MYLLVAAALGFFISRRVSPPDVAVNGSGSGGYTIQFACANMPESATRYALFDRFTDACLESDDSISYTTRFKVPNSGNITDLHCESHDPMASGHTFTVTIQTGDTKALSDTSVAAQQTGEPTAGKPRTFSWKGRVAVPAGNWVAAKHVTNSRSTPGSFRCTVYISIS